MPVMVLDAEVVLYANELARVQLKATCLADICGKPAESFAHPDTLEGGSLRRQLVLKHGAVLPPTPVKALALDGSTFYVTARWARTLVDGRPVIVVLGE